MLSSARSTLSPLQRPLCVIGGWGGRKRQRAGHEREECPFTAHKARCACVAPSPRVIQIFRRSLQNVKSVCNRRVAVFLVKPSASSHVIKPHKQTNKQTKNGTVKEHSLFPPFSLLSPFEIFCLRKNVALLRADLIQKPLFWTLSNRLPAPGGLPYMGYIGMCHCEGYGFQIVYFGIGYINQRVWF